MTIANGNYDVIIIGGGPGGIAAAIWCHDLGLSSLIVERSTDLGGQLLSIYNHIDNYPGVEARNGLEMAEFFAAHLGRRGSTVRVQAEVAGIEQEPLVVRLADGTRLSGRSLIIATGVKRRTLDVPGEVEFAGRGILRSGVKERDLVTGRRVAIIGGGDAALENALILGDVAERVYVIHRGPAFSARTDFVDNANRLPNVEILTNTIVRAFLGEDSVKAVEISSAGTANNRHLPVDFGLIRIGVEPNSEFVRDLVRTDERGYILINSNGETSLAGIFAIGDVANPNAPTIIGAAGQGATAVKYISSRLNR